MVIKVDCSLGFAKVEKFGLMQPTLMYKYTLIIKWNSMYMHAIAFPLIVHDLSNLIKCWW